MCGCVVAGSVFSVLSASKKWFPNQSFQPCILLISQNKRTNTLALPERGFGKNQSSGTEWSKVIIIKSKSWSVARVLPSLTRTAVSLDALACVAPMSCALTFPKNLMLKRRLVSACVSHRWISLDMTWKRSNPQRFLFYPLTSVSPCICRGLWERVLLILAYLRVCMFHSFLVLVKGEVSGEHWPLLCP